MVEFLKPFVPIDYQLSEKTFYDYLKTLTLKEYTSHMVSLTTHERGVTLLIYHPYTTTVNYYKWDYVKSKIDMHYDKQTIILKQLEIQF